MCCPGCGAKLPEEGDCLACGQAQPNLQVPLPPATDPHVAPARPGWRELSPVNKAVCILIAVGLAIPAMLILKAVEKEVKWWLWIRPGNTFVIENQSGQLITMATISVNDRPGKPAEGGTIRFENIPMGGEHSRSARARVSQFFIQGRLADGTWFAGGGSPPRGPYRIIISPGGEIDFGFGKPVPAWDN